MEYLYYFREYSYDEESPTTVVSGKALSSHIIDILSNHFGEFVAGVDRKIGEVVFLEDWIKTTKSELELRVDKLRSRLKEYKDDKSGVLTRIAAHNSAVASWQPPVYLGNSTGAVMRPSFQDYGSDVKQMEESLERVLEELADLKEVGSGGDDE